MEIIKAQNLDADELMFGEVKKTASGGKSVYINTLNGNGLIIQTPFMRTPFGIKTYDEESTNFSVDLSLDDSEVCTRIKENFGKLDERMIADAIKNSLEWFQKKKVEKNVLNELYNKQVRYSYDKTTGEINDKYAPTIKFKVPFYDGKFTCKVYDENKELITDDLKEVLVPGCEIKALLQCGGIWFISGKYGITWRAKQLIVKRPVGFDNYAFIDSDCDEENTANDIISDSDSD